MTNIAYQDIAGGTVHCKGMKEIKATEKYRSTYIFYSMPVGWQRGHWLIESGWIYNGLILIPATAGQQYRCGAIRASWLAGTALAIDMPLRVKIVPTAQVRISSGYVYVHFNIYPDGWLAGIGVKGFILTKKKKQRT